MNEVYYLITQHDRETDEQLDVSEAKSPHQAYLRILQMDERFEERRKALKAFYREQEKGWLAGYKAWKKQNQDKLNELTND